MSVSRATNGNSPILLDAIRAEERFSALSETILAFAEATPDPQRLLETVVLRLGQLVGDLCSIRTVSADGEWLEATEAVYHPDPEVLAARRKVRATHRQRIDGSAWAPVVAACRAELSHWPSPSDLAASVPSNRQLLDQLEVHSAITVPLKCRGQVFAVANLMRGAAREPYTQDDVLLVENIAAHAAHAIANSNSYAAERAARAEAERAVLAQRRVQTKFDYLSESGIVGIVVGNLAGRVAEINDTLLALIGYSREEIISGSVDWWSLTSPEFRESDAEAVRVLSTSGMGGLREKEYIRKDGRRVPVLVRSARIAGDAEMVISFVVDLTERKLAEAAMTRLRIERATGTLFRALLDSAPDAMVVARRDGVIAFVNGQVEALFGYSSAECVGQQVELFMPDRFRGAHPQHRAQYFETLRPRLMGAGQRLYGRRKDGSEFPIDVSLIPLETEAGWMVSTTIRDLSERKRAERRMARLATIVESTDDAIISETCDGVITSWNRGAQRLFGFPAEEIIGRPISTIVPLDKEGELHAVQLATKRGHVKRLETVHRHQDGRLIEVSVTTSPIRDSLGEIIGMSKVVRDVTERNRAEAELARAREAAESANRELESFSYSVAHDLRAPLRGMHGFAQILLNEYGAQFDAEGKDWLQEILTNSTKLGALIDGLLSLAHVTTGAMNREPVDLSELARAIARGLAMAAPERHANFMVQDGVEARADATLVRAVLENLINNAWKFTARAREARIEFGTVERDGKVMYFVRDNGVGFDMAYAKKLFGAFQRLHSVEDFPGTGIGLATVSRIVRRHGGQIFAEAAVDEGATFYFSFGSDVGAGSS